MAPLCSTSPPPFKRQNFPPLCDFCNFPSFPIPVLVLYFVLATWVQPCHPASPRPSSVSRANLVLTHTLLSFLPLSAAVLYCTVRRFGVMAVGTNGLTCGFNRQCTADAIGYVTHRGMVLRLPCLDDYVVLYTQVSFDNSLFRCVIVPLFVCVSYQTRAPVINIM